MRRGTHGLFACILLASVGLVQVAQVAHHTCLDAAHALTDEDPRPTLEASRNRPAQVTPVCFGCVLASQCGAPHLSPAELPKPPAGRARAICQDRPQAATAIADALLPRPPPSIG